MSLKSILLRRCGNMKKRTSRIIGCVMLAAAILFIIFAVTHPELGFPWENTITYFLYALYLLIMLILLIAPRRKEKRYISKVIKGE